MSVYSEAFMESRLRGKNLFKMGQVTESFDYLEAVLDKARKEVAKGS